MVCPECGKEITGKKCENCGKDIKDIYFNKSEEEEKQGNHDKALEYLYELRKHISDKEIMAEIERKVRSIRFLKDDTTMNTVQDEGSKKIKKSFIKSEIMIAVAIVFSAIIINIIYKVSINSNVSQKIDGERKLETVFLFHLNQTLTSHADFADKSSYNGLLKVLRKHKDLKFNIHIAGTLIQDLLWYSPETLQLIKDGVEDGQFELLGSTYSQNVMYSTDDESNREQLKRHKEIIKDVFGIEPEGFWNPERTWRQSLAPIITDAGYKYITLEDHITRQNSKLPEYVLRRTDNKKLIVINDDSEFMEIFNSAVDVGDGEYDVEKRGANLTEKSPEMKAIFRYLRKIYDQDKKDQFTASYAEDAEATGNWDLWAQKAPEWDFENLDKILTEIEKTKWIKTAKYSEVAKSEKVAEDIEKIDDGAATWMEKAAGNPAVNYGEGNYKNWKDYNDNSPKLAYYREMQNKNREMLKKYDNVKNEAVQKVMKLAKEALMVYQFEFGCTGIGGTRDEWESGKKFAVWERMRTMSVYYDLIERILNKKDITEEKDVNDDGIKELVVVKDDNYFIFSIARGGKILYWFDMKNGMELSGNELVTQMNEEYIDDNFSDEPFNLGDYSRFFVADDSVIEYFKNTYYYVRAKASNEIIKLKNDDIAEKFYNMSTTYVIKNNNEILFTNGSYVKIVKIEKNGFTTEYKMPDNVEKITSFSEFSPDYYSIINSGKKILETSNNNGIFKVINKKSGIGVEVNYPASSPSRIKESLFGIIIETDIMPNEKITVKKIIP